jgi:anhydro-N-acetylmuramic acid kinase
VTGTLQVGNPSIIAERTGLTVVSQFRSRDMAVGGQGAPLAPLLDFALYRHRSRGRICVNLGGIANVTGLPAGAALSSLVAFDAGPGSCLVDMTVAHFSKGQLPYDRDGEWARAGRVSDALLAALLEHPFLKLKPPKSADKEQFGRGLFQKVVSENPGMTGQDLAATFSAFTVRSLTMGLMEHLMQKDRYEEIIVSGGGSQNPYFMGGLGQAFPKLFVSSADEYAVPAQAKEAVLMALLANETLLGHPGNLPSATGAQRAVVLGVIAPGARAYADAPKEGA